MKVLCVGGGTLGPVTPLLAVVAELKRLRKDVTVEWIGTYHGPERELVESYGIKYHAIHAGKLRRYFGWENFTDAVRIIVGFFQTLKILARLKIDVVLTAGAFIAVPVGYAAWFSRIPVFAHQQDVRPSLTNKLLAPIARRITITFPSSMVDFPKYKTVLTGNPVREEFLNAITASEAKKKLNLDPNKKTLLILGGGTGAVFLNKIVTDSIFELTKFSQVIHLTGKGKILAMPNMLDYLQLEFTTSSLELMSAADLVVSRGGMGFITELVALSKPAIVVPIPHSQQEDNARLLNQMGAAIFYQQASLTPGNFIATVRQLLNDDKARERMSGRMKHIMPNDSALKIAEEVLKVVD